MPRDEELLEQDGPCGCRIFSRAGEPVCSLAIPEALVPYEFWRRVKSDADGHYVTGTFHWYDRWFILSFSDMAPGDTANIVDNPGDAISLMVVRDRPIELEIFDASVFLDVT